jgi:adenylate kinase
VGGVSSDPSLFRVRQPHTNSPAHHPQELQESLKSRGYDSTKQYENVSAEILDVCLVEALQNQEKQKICEIDATGKTIESTLKEILEILEGRKECCLGFVDWLGLLEHDGKLDQYLKT